MAEEQQRLGASRKEKKERKDRKEKRSKDRKSKAKGGAKAPAPQAAEATQDGDGCAPRVSLHLDSALLSTGLSGRCGRCGRPDGFQGLLAERQQAGVHSSQAKVEVVALGATS